MQFLRLHVYSFISIKQARNILLFPSGPQVKETAFLLPWNLAQWTLLDGSAGPAAPSLGIGYYYSSWWIHLGDLFLECKALGSGQLENALRGAWHAASPINECRLRYVHRQGEKVSPLSPSCCWNFLLKTHVCDKAAAVATCGVRMELF